MNHWYIGVTAAVHSKHPHFTFSTSARDRRDPWRSSAGALAVAGGQSPGKMAIWGLLRSVTVQSPAGDRQVIADTVIRAVQGHQNRAASYRCGNLKIRQKSHGRRWNLVQLGRRLKAVFLIKTQNQYWSEGSELNMGVWIDKNDK